MQEPEKQLEHLGDNTVDMTENVDDYKENREERMEAFRVFMSNIQRKWSPSVLTGVNGSLPDSFPTKESFDANNFQFNWSIDQIALLNPADFSSERNDSFFEGALNESFSQRLRQDCQDFFNQSQILPSPTIDRASVGISMRSSASSSSFQLLSCPTTSAATGLHPCFSRQGRSPQSLNISSIPTAAYSVYSPFSTSRLKNTPDREDKDMSVTESKQPTPLNATKIRRKKSKLFVDDASGHLLTLEEDSNSCCSTTADDTEFDLRTDSMTAYSSMPLTDLALSPIQVHNERARMGGNVGLEETDEAFSREISSMDTTTNHFESRSQVTSIDSGCISKIQRSVFYKTSTPSHQPCPQDKKEHH